MYATFNISKCFAVQWYVRVQIAARFN